MSPYKIRPITDGDIPFLWEMLYQSLYVKEGEKPFDRIILQEPDIAKYAADWGRKGDLGFIAVNAEGQPIGSITIRTFTGTNKGFGYVSDEVPEIGMAILPSYRGMGIGSALLQQLFNELRVRKINRVSLSVDPLNTAAVKLYIRYGFKEVETVGTSVTMVAEV
ncbi:GNAT family N-acetyltransferase [Paenibacillus sp. 1001270B_150601_E10]|uniref:GNAT family N-acetyltransferase n=1 Tax=Paenibacillus sp. 1001270B_150601_E10 TaxID=2787079 RepID=UPI001E54FF90|nr:GNAT family N-acetyltransferase [Paenibacillus sp. 1001270B_150601_E10]